MKKTAKSKIRSKKSLIIRIIAVLLMTFPIMLLGMVSVSLYLHFFTGYPIPEDVAWALNLLLLSAIAFFILFIAVQLFRGKNYAKILGAAAFIIIAIWNLKAEIFNTEHSFPSIVFNTIYLFAGIYLILHWIKTLRKIRN